MFVKESVRMPSSVVSKIGLPMAARFHMITMPLTKPATIIEWPLVCNRQIKYCIVYIQAFHKKRTLTFDQVIRLTCPDLLHPCRTSEGFILNVDPLGGPQSGLGNPSRWMSPWIVGTATIDSRSESTSRPPLGQNARHITGPSSSAMMDCSSMGCIALLSAEVFFCEFIRHNWRQLLVGVLFEIKGISLGSGWQEMHRNCSSWDDACGNQSNVFTEPPQKSVCDWVCVIVPNRSRQSHLSILCWPNSASYFFTVFTTNGGDSLVSGWYSAASLGSVITWISLGVING